MSKTLCWMALSLLVGACGGACGRISAASRDDGGTQAAGTGGLAGAIDGGQGGAGGAAGGQSGAAGGQSGAAGGQGGAAGGQGGAAGGQTGATGGQAGASSLESLSGCFPAAADATGSFTPKCATTCGNGTIDSCKYTLACPGSAGQCPTETFTEVCDGSALGTSTCASLGFSGGALRCGAWCGFDTRGCDACEHGAGIAACVSAVPEVASPTSLALAATDTEIAIAWLDGDVDASRTGLRFARFRPDLSRLSQSECFGPAAPTQAALAATRSGWLLAATAADGVHLFALAPTGAPGPDRLLPGAKDPLLVARPAAGPLLYWTAGGMTFVKLLRADGADETTAVAIFPYVIDRSAGVFTGDGFLLASRLAQLVMTRVGVDGKMASQTTIASTMQPTGYAPGLAWNGTNAAVTYDVGDPSTTNTTGLAWVRVDRTGAPAAAPTLVAAFPMGNTSESISGAELAVLGSDLVILARPDAQLVAAKLDGNGATIVAPFGLARDPSRAREYRLTNRGVDVIAAWVTEGFGQPGTFPGRIGLARLAP